MHYTCRTCGHSIYRPDGMSRFVHVAAWRDDHRAVLDTREHRRL